MSLETTFSTFIPLKSNKKALQISKQKTKEIVQSFQTNTKRECIAPLLITSHCGAGKTHLLHSIQVELKSLNVISIYAENFIHYFEQGKLKSFCQQIKKADILLIEDLHFLIDYSWTSDEIYKKSNDAFIKISNYFYHQGKPFIATVCFNVNPLKDVELLKKIQISLPFLIENKVTIHKLDYEDRVTLLQQLKLQIGENLFSDKELKKIAKKHFNNTLSIVGIVQRILAEQRLKNIKAV